MDDLSGLDWSSGPASDQGTKKTSTSAAFYPTLRPTPPTPLSGRSSPLSGPSKPASKPSTPANDSFSNLVSFGSTKNTNNLSLQERQRQLQEQKRKEEAERQEKLNSQFRVNDNQFWDGLGRSNGNRTSSANGAQSDDLLSAFSSAAAVDSSSHFPPPVSSGHDDVALNTKAKVPQSFQDNDEDDPFELKKHQATRTVTLDSNGEDDVLGLLAKPVSELPKPQRSSNQDHEPIDDAKDRAAADIVDMGFPIDKAKAALATTESGTDVQAAIGWLLNQAHEQSKQKTNGPSLPHPQRAPVEELAAAKTSARRSPARPAWIDEDSTSKRDIQRTHSTSPANGDKDISQIATEVGNNLFKTANSLWNTSRKKVQKAVQDLQQDGDLSQPKWDARGSSRRKPNTGRLLGFQSLTRDCKITSLLKSMQGKMRKAVPTKHCD